MQHHSQPAIRSIGIVGAGVMGRGIASACLAAGFDVTLTDSSPTALHSASLPPCDRYSGRLRTTETMTDLADSDLIIESIVEKERVKRRLFMELESYVSSTTLFGTNTSSIPVGTLAASMRYPERLCGLHFCHPVDDRRLIEVVRGPDTGDASIQQAVGIAAELGKIPIVVGDSPGFVLNRLLLPYLNESLELLLDGAAAADVEAAGVALGMPMGPLAMVDSFGIDVILRTGAIFQRAWPHRAFESQLLPDLYCAGRLGQKTGCGFLSWRGGDPSTELDASARELVARLQRSGRHPTADQIRQRLLMSLILEATRVLEEQIARNAADVDTSLRHGVNFRPAHDGLLTWAEQLGPDEILRRLQDCSTDDGRFDPTPTLLRLADERGSFLGPARRRNAA